MATTFLHFRGLRPGETTWFNNRRFAQVTVRPGDWVRIDLDRHPELVPSLKTGAAVVESKAPPNTTVLDEESESGLAPDRGDRGDHAERRSRSSGLSGALQLTEADLDTVAHCLLPWDNWSEDVKMDHIDARSDQRGAPRDTTLHLFFEKNFVVIHRLAELWARLVVEKSREARDRRVGSRWAFGAGEYASKKACRQLVYGLVELPRRDEIVLAKLRDWGVWRKPRLPSVSTLRRYRASFITGCPVRRYIDEQILFLYKMPRQRIFLGPQYAFRIGPHVPNKAAAVLAEIGTPVRPLILDVLPAFHEAPGGVKRRVELQVTLTSTDMAKLLSVTRSKGSGSTGG